MPNRGNPGVLPAIPHMDTGPGGSCHWVPTLAPTSSRFSSEVGGQRPGAHGYFERAAVQKGLRHCIPLALTSRVKPRPSAMGFGKPPTKLGLATAVVK